MDKDTICAICKEPINGYGNNPAPLKVEGEVCDECNSLYVIPARLEAMGFKAHDKKQPLVIKVKKVKR